MDENEIRYLREELGMPDGSISELATAYLAKHPKCETAGRSKLRAILETGYPGWYSWCVANWGTKWNSYCFQLLNDDPLEFVFETAWDFPEPVFVGLAQAFPTLHFRCQVTEEIGQFAGDGYFNPPSGEQPWQRSYDEEGDPVDTGVREHDNPPLFIAKASQ
jgi:hypothetical protein